MEIPLEKLKPEEAAKDDGKNEARSEEEEKLRFGI